MTPPLVRSDVVSWSWLLPCRLRALPFDFERLDAFQVAKEALRIGDALFRSLPRGYAALSHEGRCSSTIDTRSRLPTAQIFRRGKIHEPAEFGRVIEVQEAEGWMVTTSAASIARRTLSRGRGSRRRTR